MSCHYDQCTHQSLQSLLTQMFPISVLFKYFFVFVPIVSQLWHYPSLQPQIECSEVRSGGGDLARQRGEATPQGVHEILSWLMR